MFVDLQILQVADERHEAELYQKDEEIRQKNTQLEVTLGGNIGGQQIININFIYQTIYIV